MSEPEAPKVSSGPPPPRPGWVKALGIALVVVVAVVIAMAISGGEHGPGRHLPGGGGPGADATAPHDG